MFKKRVPNSGDILYQALQNLIPKSSTNYQLESKLLFFFFNLKFNLK
jgi:hypothetical protein